MLVWLHTSSPPQHINNISEVELQSTGGIEHYLTRTNERRGLSCEFAGVFEGPHGETSIHVFDTMERAVDWTARNVDESLLVDSLD